MTIENVLFILADDMRADVLPFMPFTYKLSRHGIRFTRGFVSTPICQAARAGFLTGQYASGPNNDVYQNFDLMTGPDSSLLPTWLPSPVQSAVFGKVPLGYGPLIEPGWDYWRSITGGDQKTRGYTIADGLGGTTTPTPHQVIELGDLASAYMVAETDPWFTWLCFTNPHINVTSFTNNPLPSSLKLFQDYRWPIVPLEDVSSKPSWVQAYSQFTEEQFQTIRLAINQQLREAYDMDVVIEGIYNDLVAANLIDTTLIIFSSDNGCFYGEHRTGSTATASKDEPYDVASNVPFFMVGPGIPRRINRTAVNLQDVTATIVDVFGGTPSIPTVGTSLLDFVINEDLDRGVLYERRDHATLPDAQGVFTGRYKLIHYYDETGDDEWEMYDNVNDPNEHVNVAQEPAYAVRRLELEGKLNELI